MEGNVCSSTKETPCHTTICLTSENTNRAAPDEEHRVYRITASLRPEEREYRVIGSSHCLVATGGKAELRVAADPPTVEAGGDGTIDYRVVDGQGRLLKPNGTIVIQSPPDLEVEAPRWLGGDQAKGSAPYHASKKAGDYTVRVTFTGYVDAGYLHGQNYLPAEAEVRVQVTAAARAATPPEPTTEADGVPNLIPGTYDGQSNQYRGGGWGNTWTMALSGDASSVNWSWTYRTGVREHKVYSRRSGTATSIGLNVFDPWTGETTGERFRVLEGEFVDELTVYRGIAKFYAGKSQDGWRIGEVHFYRWPKNRTRPEERTPPERSEHKWYDFAKRE